MFKYIFEQSTRYENSIQNILSSIRFTVESEMVGLEETSRYDILNSFFQKFCNI